MQTVSATRNKQRKMNQHPLLRLPEAIVLFLVPAVYNAVIAIWNELFHFVTFLQIPLNHSHLQDFGTSFGDGVIKGTGALFGGYLLKLVNRYLFVPFTKKLKSWWKRRKLKT